MLPKFSVRKPLTVFVSVVMVFILGFVLPEAIGFLLRTFRNNCSTYNNSTFVFNLVNENEGILCYYKYIVNMYFSL